MSMKVRSTITLDEDTAAAVDRFRREQGLGPSAAVNVLIRRGLAETATPRRYRHRSAHLGLKVDVTNVAEVLDLLDG